MIDKVLLSLVRTISQIPLEEIFKYIGVLPFEVKGDRKVKRRVNKEPTRKSWLNLKSRAKAVFVEGRPSSPFALSRAIRYSRFLPILRGSSLLLFFSRARPWWLAWPVESTWRDQLIALHRFARQRKPGRSTALRLSGKSERIGRIGGIGEAGALATLVVRQPLRHLGCLSLH